MSDSEQEWCICRKSDISRFMIACDKCEEWYHGDCIGVTSQHAENILKFYCKRCLKRHPNLKIVYKVSPDKFKVSDVVAPVIHEKPVMKKRPQKPLLPGPPSKKMKLERGISNDSGSFVAKPRKLKPHKQNLPAKLRSAAVPELRQRGKLYQSKANVPKVPEVKQQCEGVDCCNTARKGSAYCSEDCGMQRAVKRLRLLLPEKLKEWNVSPSVAEKHDALALTHVRQSAEAARSKLTWGELRHQALDLLVARGKTLKVSMAESKDSKEEEDTTILCPSCSLEVSIKSMLRHLWKCYTRIEGQTSFGSMYKAQMDGTPLFCDRFNPQAQTYCKKLMVLCPDHYREAKSLDMEACGAPLTDDEENGSLCVSSKNKCTRHFGWERLRRAEIDIDRLRQLMKLEDLLFDERSIRQSMMGRGGVPGILLHTTTDHEPEKPLVPTPYPPPKMPPNHAL